MSDTSSKNPTTHESTFDLIERSGGWRLVMQGKTSNFDAVTNALESTHIQSHPSTYLGVAFYLAKRGNTQLSRKLLNEFIQSNKHLSSHSDGVAPLQENYDQHLVDIHISIYEDRELGDREARLLAKILHELPPHDHLGRALAMNHLCTVFLHLGEFNRSQGYAESAMRAYADGKADYGSLHLHTHLGQIRLARGELSGAEQEYQSMAAGLETLAEPRPDMMSICQALRSEVAYEMNDINLSRSLLDAALSSVEDQDAWLDVLAAVYRVSSRLALLSSGLPGALSALAHAEHIASERGMPRLRRLMRVEKIRALTLSDELQLAKDEIILAELDGMVDAANWDDEADWAMRQGATAVALARYLVRIGRAERALSVLSTAEDRAIRNGQMLAVAKLRVIRASAFWRIHKQRDAVQSLVDAVRLLGKQPFRRFILDEGPELQQMTQMALDGDYVHAKTSPVVRKRLTELNHHWAVFATQTVQDTVNRNLNQDQLSNSDVAQLARQRYLELLAVGLSNKEIGRTMGVSENTVKYHLKNIFKELGVSNRTVAVNSARELGII